MQRQGWIDNFLAFGGDTYEKLSFKTVLSKSHLNLYNFNYLFDELTPGLDKDFDGRPKRARLWGFESILAKKERLSDETEIEDLEQIVAPFIKSFKSLGQTQRLSFNYYRNEGMIVGLIKFAGSRILSSVSKAFTGSNCPFSNRTKFYKCSVMLPHNEAELLKFREFLTEFGKKEQNTICFSCSSIRASNDSERKLFCSSNQTRPDHFSHLDFNSDSSEDNDTVVRNNTQEESDSDTELHEATVNIQTSSTTRTSTTQTSTAQTTTTRTSTTTLGNQSSAEHIRPNLNRNPTQIGAPTSSRRENIAEVVDLTNPTSHRVNNDDANSSSEFEAWDEETFIRNASQQNNQTHQITSRSMTNTVEVVSWTNTGNTPPTRNVNVQAAPIIQNNTAATAQNPRKRKTPDTVTQPTAPPADTEEEEKCCVVCLTNKPEFIAVPCGHFSYCEKCIHSYQSAFKKCAVCRKAVVNFCRVFM